MSKPARLPEWFKQSQPKAKAGLKLASYLGKNIPNSICQEAKCPNRGECWSRGVLTFMILGTVCTRNCAFCSVRHGRPMPPDLQELNDILAAIQRLELKFVVLTSPNRDDLPDNGAGHYAMIVKSIKESYPKVKVEVLIPDFQGEIQDLQTVVLAKPDVLNHNLETVPSLYRSIRKGSLYERSHQVLRNAKKLNPSILTKTGLMVGLGETKEELIETFKDIKASGVDILTLGQYLKPGRDNADVVRFYTPEEFAELKAVAESIGIRYVFAGPLVRSSYLADHVFENVNDNPLTHVV